ncbi:MAG TPA: hypothetical protein VMS31_21595 [Pyrinomonadaceae bacterium]|nr:hypothetical protein [Pyrinomonadaceae bacterium]
MKRIKPSLLQTDRDSLVALLRLAGYSPVNLRYALNVLETTCEELDDAQQAEVEALAAAASARLKAVSKEWDFHTLMLGAKDQVVAQFGRDSNEAKALGLKKKSEYKTRARKQAAKETEA